MPSLINESCVNGAIAEIDSIAQQLVWIPRQNGTVSTETPLLASAMRCSNANLIHRQTH